MFKYALRYFKNNFSRHIPLLLGVVAVCYFGFHMLHGNRGAFSYMKLKNEYTKLLFELDELKLQKSRIENKISLLKGTIDLDILEELVERNLGLVYKNDVVIIGK